MSPYLILIISIALEVLGTVLLPASHQFSKILPSIVIVLSYCFSFYLLALLTDKLPLAVIYASWSGVGIFSITLLSYILYNQTTNWISIAGLLLIVIGVTMINVYKI